MKTYSDKVLTVIALCLIIQTISQITWVESAYAARPTTVTICELKGTVCADMAALGYNRHALLVKVVD